MKAEEIAKLAVMYSATHDNIERVTKAITDFANLKTKELIREVEQLKGELGELEIESCYVSNALDVRDDELQQAKEQLDPFYNQTLSDYLEGVQSQRSRGLADQDRLISELNQDINTLNKDLKFDLQQSLEKAKQGASGAGLLSSGFGQRAEGLTEREGALRQEELGTKAQRRKETITTGTHRTLEDLQRQQNIVTRDLEAERKAQTNILGSQLTREEGVRRGFELRQALGPLADESNDFDILKGLT